MDKNEEKTDYLEVDDTLPGQDWVCLSFVDPDDMVFPMVPAGGSNDVVLLNEDDLKKI